MMYPKVLEPPTEQAEIECLDETIGFLDKAKASGDPTGNIELALVKLRAARKSVAARPHRGLVDYDQRVHG